MSRKQRIGRHYEPRLQAYRTGHRVLDWASAASQRARFTVLVENVDLTGKTLLDVGCGLGDLYGFCRKRRIAVDYFGVDILETMIRAARLRHGDGRFICADIFAGTAFEVDGVTTFDAVFCSGTFNLNLGNSRTFLPTAISRLQELARRQVVVNFLDARYRPHDDRYSYHDPQEVLEMLKPSGWEARIIEGYLPNDFTVICTRLASR